MSTELATRNGAEMAIARDGGAVIEAVIGYGDLSKMSTAERTEYYRSTCQSMGLNPLTQPFEYITLNGKMRLYAKKDATDQLRRINNVSIVKLEKVRDGDSYEVTAYAQMPDGRMDSSLGAVYLKGLSGDAYSNALMKAETKAKRRVTLSICGLGWLDESEIDSIPGARIGEHSAPPVNEFPSQRKAQIAAPTEKPVRLAESTELLKKVASAAKTLDKSQIAALSAEYGNASLKEMTDAQLTEAYDKIKKINTAQAAAAQTEESDPFAE